MLYLTVLEAPCSTPAPPAMPGRILLRPIARWAAGHLKEEEPVHILVNFPDPAERDALYGMLRIWMELSCASVDIVTAEGAGGAAPTFHRILGSGQLGAAAFKLAVSRLRPVSLLKRSTPRYRQLFLPSHWVPHKARFDGAFVGSHAPLFPHVVFLAHAAGGLS